MPKPPKPACLPRKPRPASEISNLHLKFSKPLDLTPDQTRAKGQALETMP